MRRRAKRYGERDTNRKDGEERKVNRLRTWITGLALAVLVVAAGCGTKATDVGQAGQAGDGGKETIVVGTDAAYAPFEYVDADNNIVGFDIDLMKAIAEVAGFDVQFVNTAWEGIFITLQNGERDALISAITITDERKETMDFSEPYFEATQLIAVPQNADVTKFADLKAKNLRVGVQTGTTGDVAVSALLGKTSPNIKRYETTPHALQALAIGEVDAVVADNAVVLHYIQHNPNANFKAIADPSFPKESYGIAVKKGNKELLDKINRGLKAIKENGRYDEIYTAYFGKQ